RQGEGVRQAPKTQNLGLPIPLRGSLSRSGACGSTALLRSIPMARQHPHPEDHLSATEKSTSKPPKDMLEAQLSDRSGVQSDVSSVALDRGFLSMAGVPQSNAEAGGLSDAQVMLRVKEGDESAFDYLVQKYRRPIVNFMYRMAHNSAAAEDL